MARQNLTRWMVQGLLLFVPMVLLITYIIQKSINPLTVLPEGLRRVIAKNLYASGDNPGLVSGQSATPCPPQNCADNHFSFFAQSGAANIVGPKICVNNKLFLGTALNNAGVGINVVAVDGNTGEVMKTITFNTYNGDVAGMNKFLTELPTGSVVLMASYDEPATKLNDEARKLIGELGSTYAQKLGFRDSWAFVGGKGTTAKSSFEKYLKSDKATNKYGDWPEVVQLQGCVPLRPNGPAATDTQQKQRR